MFFLTRKKFLIISCFTLLATGLFFYYFAARSEGDFFKKQANGVFNPAFLARVAFNVGNQAQRKAGETQQEETNQARVILPDFTSLRDVLQASKTDFIEANLRTMKIAFYQKGEKQKQADILKRGDDYAWGGTAAGIYQIKSGYKAAFSAIAEVYMPFAMNFFGKYYLHGEPYYPSGEKMTSDSSGGCLQVSDATAWDFFEKAQVGMPFLVIDKTNDDFVYIKTAQLAPPEINADTFLVADLGSGEVILEKNITKQKQIASLTKLMTAIIVAESVDLRKKIVVKDYMLQAGFGETDSVKEGDYLDVVDLFYPLLIESSNDAAEALSGFLGRQKTIDLMNAKAQAILMPSTTFACPSGYSQDNVSTVRDLFYLARYIFNNRPLLFDVSRSKEVPGFGSMPFDITSLWNKNVFSEDETFVGGKTGFIKTSGYNGLFVFKLQPQNGTAARNIVFILLDTPRLDDVKFNTQKLYIWLQNSYFAK